VKYPEYEGEVSDSYNPAYEGLRKLFQYLGLDSENFGTSHWNPLKELVKPGDKVVIKPNWVIARENPEATVTHPSVIRALVDYVRLAGASEILVADAPQYDCDWNKLMAITGMRELIQWWKGSAKVLDLRNYWSPKFHWGSKLLPLPGDPSGEVLVDLGTHSYLETLEGLDRLYGAAPWTQETRHYHRKGKHQYILSRTLLEADVLILVPKLKTHKKVGLTLCAKNLVGVVTNKNTVPHFRIGIDQLAPWVPRWYRIFALTEMLMYKTLLGRRTWWGDLLYKMFFGFWFKDLFQIKTHPHDRGNWWGNDTLWRAVRDLVTIIRHSKLRTFCVADAIVAGEGEGPLNPTPVPLGLLIGGFSLEAVDWIASTLVGFDPKKLRLEEPREKIEIVGDVPEEPFRLKPSSGWVGYL